MTYHQTHTNERTQALAQELGLRHLEVSAKNGKNVHETFAYLATDLFRLKRALHEAGRHMSTTSSSEGGRSSIIRLSSLRPGGNDGNRPGTNSTFDAIMHKCCQL